MDWTPYDSFTWARMTVACGKFAVRPLYDIYVCDMYYLGTIFCGNNLYFLYLIFKKNLSEMVRGLPFL